MSPFATGPIDVRGSFVSLHSVAEPLVADHPGVLLAKRDVSVVVPTYRPPDMLAKCLGALAEQDFPADRYEIVVCDDGPDDATRECVTRFADEQARRGRPVGIVVRVSSCCNTLRMMSSWPARKRAMPSMSRIALRMLRSR